MRDGAVYYVFPDYLGTPRTVKNTAGATVWKWASDPYGVQAPNENPGGVSLFHWNARFPGQYADDESLLYFNNARYYDAPTGRYYSSDPIGLDGGSNTYVYVRGNPLGAVDPTGNFLMVVLGVISLGMTAYDLYTSGPAFVKSMRTGCKTDWGAGANVLMAVTPFGAVAKPLKLAKAVKGEFSIVNWTNYPSGIVRPTGPFRILEGAEYEAARKAANSANKKIRQELNLGGQPLDIHEIHPVKFGGSPTDPANKLVLPRDVHQKQMTPWWNQLSKDINNQ